MSSSPAAQISIRSRRRWRVCWYALGVVAILGAGAFAGLPYLRGWYHWRAAEQALAQRDLESARSHLSKCLLDWPRSSATHLLAARTARRALAFDEAEEHLRQCERLEADATPETTLEQALLEAQRSGLTPEQEKYLRDLLQQGDANALYILEVLTSECMRRDRYLDVQRLLERWLELRLDDPEALARRGWVAERFFDYAEACRNYEKVLAQEPQRDNVRLRLAEALLESGRALEAREQLEVLQRKQPDDVVLVKLARCQMKLGDIEQARELLDGVLARSPDNLGALTERGYIALQVGELRDAERWLRRAEEQAPFDRRVLANLILVLEGRSKKEEAKKLQHRLKAIDDDLKRMRDLFQELLKKPHDADVRYQMGMIFMRNQQTKEAARWFATALEEDKLHRPTHKALVDYYERLGDKKRADVHRQILQNLAQPGK
jgi:Tfp pilus assembly protein PilF